MESQDQILAPDKSVSENEEIELQTRNPSDTSLSEGNASGSVTEHLQESKSMSDEVAPKNDKGKDISTESSNFSAESKSEGTPDKSRDVSVEKTESLCVLTESSNRVVHDEKSDTIAVEVGDKFKEKDLSQALTGGEKIETTSNESSFTTSLSDDKALSHNNGASSDGMSQESSDKGSVSKCTKKASQIFSTGTDDEDSRVESLRSLCLRQKDAECGNLPVDADFIKGKKETFDNEKSSSSDELLTLARASNTGGDGSESAIFKFSADDEETTALKSTGNKGKADATKIPSVKNVIEKQSGIATQTSREENFTFEKSAASTKNAADDKQSAATRETVGESFTKKHSNTAADTEISHLKQDENVTNKFLSAGKIVSETESADVGTSETVPQFGETEEDRERRAFFYISSSSVPGMGKEWEWPSVSSDSHYQRPPRRMERRRNTSESPNCLGTQRCHYIILAVGVLGAILGCLTYHLQDYGIGPKVLRPIGASAAFLSFVVCAFSSVYLTYLSYHTQERSSRGYRPLGGTDPVANMLVDTVPQAYSSDPRFFYTSTAAATAQQIFRETQSADALDRRGYSWQHQTEIKRPFGEPGPSGYDPDSKRFKMDPTTSGWEEAYEMKTMRRNGEDLCKERNPSQASDDSHYTLADQVCRSNRGRESEINEKTPLLPKK